jgi:DNA modification methylase
MQIEKKPIESLNPAVYNPRKDLKAGDTEYEKIKNSILHFGYIDPIIVNKDGTIIGGHQRYKVLNELGYKEIEVVMLDLSKDEEKALNIALNKISGEWDMEQLGALLSELQGAGLSDLTGFDPAEISAILGEEKVTEDEFNLEDNIPEKPFSQRGDIWCLGNHRVLCGDSTSQQDIKKLMENELADCIVTDPPYNVDYEGTTGMKIQNDNMEDQTFFNFLTDFYKRAYEVAKTGCPIYIFHADSEGLNFRKAMRTAGWEMKQCLIWVKNSLVLGRQDYQWKHEPCLYGWKSGTAHKWYGARDKDTVIDLQDKTDFKKMSKAELVKMLQEIEQKEAEGSSVIYCDKPSKNDMHPTMKPLRLIGKLLHNSSTKGDCVLDPFGGSGSTLITCEQMGRKCYTNELDEKYVDVIVKRYIQFMGNAANVFLIRDGKKMCFEDLETQLEEDEELAE